MMIMPNPIPKSLVGKTFRDRPQDINKNGYTRRTTIAILREMKSRGYNELTKEDVKAMYLTMIDMPREELEEIRTDDNAAVFTRIVAESLLSGRGYEILEKMLDRAIGKPTQELSADITSNGQTLGVVVLPQRDVIPEKTTLDTE